MNRNTKADRSRKKEQTPKARVKSYLANALAPDSLAGYLSDLRHFKACGGRIPATPEMVARYLANCAGQYKVSTLARRLAAISHAHAAIRHKTPVRSELVRRTMRGIMRVHGTAIKQAKPVSLTLLRVLARPRQEVSTQRDLRDRALLLLGFAGGFRRSELVALRPTDLALSRQGLVITVRRSKTDRYAKGRTVAISLGRGRLCAVRPLVQWMKYVQQIDPKGADNPIFRSLDRHGNIGERLTATSVGVLLKQRLLCCGCEVAGFSAHSLRAGLVTASAAAGSPTWAIQRQTGHRAEQSVHRYVRGIDGFSNNAFDAAVASAHLTQRFIAKTTKTGKKLVTR